MPTLLFEMPTGMEWTMITFLGIGFIILALIPGIFYLLTLQSTLKSISPQNRKMPPGNVWLLLIPLFNLVWHFVVVIKIAASIRAEADLKNISEIPDPKPAYNIGMAASILFCCNIIPGINRLTGIAGLICWIIYWVKVNDYKNILNKYSTFNLSDYQVS